MASACSSANAGASCKSASSGGAGAGRRRPSPGGAPTQPRCARGAVCSCGAEHGMPPGLCWLPCLPGCSTQTTGRSSAMLRWDAAVVYACMAATSSRQLFQCLRKMINHWRCERFHSQSSRMPSKGKIDFPQHSSMRGSIIVFLLQEALGSMHMRRLLHSMVSAWRQRVDDKRQLAAMCARISGWHAQRRLRRMFAAWLELTQLENLSKQQEQVTWHQQHFHKIPIPALLATATTCSHCTPTQTPACGNVCP